MAINETRAEENIDDVIYHEEMPEIFRERGSKVERCVTDWIKGVQFS